MTFSGWFPFLGNLEFRDFLQKSFITYITGLWKTRPGPRLKAIKMLELKNFRPDPALLKIMSSRHNAVVWWTQQCCCDNLNATPCLVIKDKIIKSKLVWPLEAKSVNSDKADRAGDWWMGLPVENKKLKNARSATLCNLKPTNTDILITQKISKAGSKPSLWVFTRFRARLLDRGGGF